MWLGIDLGTSGVKAVVVDDEGAVVGQAAAPLTVSRPIHFGLSRRRAIGGIAPTPQCKRSMRVSARRARHRPCRPDAWRHAAGRGRSMRCGPRSCGTTAAVSPNATRWSTPSRSARDHRQYRRCRASPRPSCCGCAAMSRRSFRAVRKVLLPKDYVRLCMTGA